MNVVSGAATQRALAVANPLSDALYMSRLHLQGVSANENVTVLEI